MNAASPAASTQATAATTGAEDKKRSYAFFLSPAAARALYENLRKRGTPESALRVGVRGGGCSGFSYVIEFADGEPKKRDLVFEFDVPHKQGDEQTDEKVRVFCDKKSILYLNETTLDWEKTLMYQGYRFRNPQEKSSCGCNESFAV